MKLYKLTDQDHMTQGNTKWGANVTRRVKRVAKEPRLCSQDVLHAYKSKELALLLNPIHAGLSSPVIWEAEGKVVAQDYGKVGVFELTTTHMIRLPKWYQDPTTRKRVQVMFAILCAEAVLHHYTDEYPDDKRVADAIKAAREYLRVGSASAESAVWSAVWSAESAARSAASAAASAARSAESAVWSAVWSAESAARSAASAAASAARSAESAGAPLDFNAIAKQAVKEIVNAN